MYKIQTLNNISVKGLERLPRDKYEVASEMTAPDGILVRSTKMHEMDIPDSLRAVGRAGAGVNNIPLDRMSEAGVVVFNAPGANSNAVKELVISGMLLAARNIPQAWDYARKLEGTDPEIAKQTEAGKKQYVGYELPGRTLGVVGLGAIGVLVANAARDLGMNVVGFDPSMTVQSAWQISSGVEQCNSVDELLSKVDFVTFHVPLLDSTRDLINAERIARMRDGVVVLNFARDGIVNDVDVAAAIESGKVGAYVCDFPCNALKDKKGVITLPHLGASTGEAEENCAIMVADQVSDYLENGNVRNSVNFPNLSLARAGDSRIAVVNSNIPDMLAQISQQLGACGANIRHMANESRGDLAYTLVDVDGDVSDETLDAIRGIEGVRLVRLLA